jgi:hypothetical protein
MLQEGAEGKLAVHYLWEEVVDTESGGVDTTDKRGFNLKTP